MADIFSIVNPGDSGEGQFSELQAILPPQFYAGRRGTAEGEPLRRLMVAMLIDAVRCFQSKFESRQPGRRQEFAEVRSWLFSDVDDGPFSFRTVCEELEVDPEALRKGLLRWAANTGPRGKPRIVRRAALSPNRISA